MTKRRVWDVLDEVIDEAEVRVKMGEAAATLPRDHRQRRNQHIGPFMGELLISKVDYPKLREFLIHLREKGLKTGTINPIMSTVSVMLKHARDMGYVRDTPDVPRAKHKDAPRPAFTKQEYSAFLEGCKRVEGGKPRVSFKGHQVTWELRALCTFMVNSFVRPGDLFVLRHKHVQPNVTEDGQPYLRLDYPSSKGHAAPVITMPAAAKIYKRVLERRGSDPAPEDYVFLPDIANRTYAHEVIRRQFTQVLEHLDLKRTPTDKVRTLYSLRHSAITFRLLNAEDLDLLTLARNCRTSVEMIDRFYASSLTAEMAKERIIGFRRPTRHTRPE